MFSTSLAFTFLCLGYSTANFVCPPNEFYDSYGTACPPTCQKPVIKYCTYNFAPGCFCVPNFIRDEISGMCVKTCP
ncbi:chymotrypsin inhibitor-like isoform X2 [Coccinella septempunctata]|uniref:chymotrypsin inhibitor-like isoform X2 n=1 Tax=Coccinella septempunctata TaxID=41139 RepID=UPI001D083865|nr:chymotrypsin inhibitor-like isoform X2 [Coccinella septempunctata]